MTAQNCGDHGRTVPMIAHSDLFHENGNQDHQRPAPAWDGRQLSTDRRHGGLQGQRGPGNRLLGFAPDQAHGPWARKRPLRARLDPDPAAPRNENDRPQRGHSKIQN